MSDPFLIQGPALISFSGGRTSAYMLWRILQAHGGTLPDDVHVCFSNTGKERPETLRFVHECGSRWGVPVRWLEWRPTEPGKRGKKITAEVAEDRFEEVGFNSASRNGEPFKALIQRKQFVPNSVTRYCTTKLKIETMKHFMLANGHDHYLNIVGLRADEPHRVIKQLERNLSGVERYTSAMPLWKAGLTKRDVLMFWFGKSQIDLSIPPQRLPQGFDLGLRDYEGNCDLCFLKGRGKLAQLIRENPGMEDWWVQMEAEAKPEKVDGARFRKDESFAELARATHASPLLFDTNEGSDPDDEHDAECGTWCTGEAA